MMDVPTGGYPQVTAKIPVRADVNQTVGQTRQQAARYTVTMLRSVADLIVTHGPEKLVEMMHAPGNGREHN
jgi:hypothetical protein